MVLSVLMTPCFKPRGRQLYFCLTLGFTDKVSGLKVTNWAAGIIIIVGSTHVVLDDNRTLVHLKKRLPLLCPSFCSSVLDSNLFDLAYFEHHSTVKYLLQKMDFLMLILLFGTRALTLFFVSLLCELFSLLDPL